MSSKIDFKRVNNDINGNPRYVCHYSSLLKDSTKYGVIEGYTAAVAVAKKIGGKMYRGKDFGGGIVFQSYNIGSTEASILELVNQSK